MEFGKFLHKNLICAPERKIFGNIPESPVDPTCKRAGNIVNSCVLEFIEIEKQAKR